MTDIDQTTMTPTKKRQIRNEINSAVCGTRYAYGWVGDKCKRITRARVITGGFGVLLQGRVLATGEWETLSGYDYQ